MADGRRTDDGGVLPPFNGGLHCGFRPRAWLNESTLCSRLSTAGSIAAGSNLHGFRAGQVLPPFNGGLHCGRVRELTLPCPYHVLPPFNGGLHCGGYKQGGDDDGTRCSRLSTAGSIAAPMRPAEQGAARRCSRLSTAGSIAARFRPGRHGRRFPGAPAFQRRAPLRPQQPADVTERGEGAPAFQRRAPLRPPLPARAYLGWLVLPPFNGGLHCGDDDQPLSLSSMAVLPPFNGGLHCGEEVP